MTTTGKDNRLSASGEVKVMFFASLGEAVGCKELLIRACDLQDLVSTLGTTLDAGAMQALQAENVRIAVNQQLVDTNIALHSGDEVAFLPPVTGG